MARIVTTALAAVTAMTLISSAAPAAPIGDALSLSNAAQSNIEQVRARGGGWRGHGGRGWGGAAAGFAAGAILGGIIASQPYYGPGPYYYGPVYGPGPYYYGPGDPVAYCMSRFRSYDPVSGTYMGYDGLRHPCP
jgi:hypothetical protein